MKAAMLLRLKLVRGHLTRAAVCNQFVGDLLAFIQALKTGPLDGGDVHESILAAVVGLDEAETLGRIEPLHSAGRHRRHLAFRRSTTGRGQWRSVCDGLAVAKVAAADRSEELGRDHPEPRRPSGSGRTIADARGDGRRKLAGLRGCQR